MLNSHGSSTSEGMPTSDDSTGTLVWKTNKFTFELNDSKNENKTFQKINIPLQDRVRPSTDPRLQKLMSRDLVVPRISMCLGSRCVLCSGREQAF